MYWHGMIRTDPSCEFFLRNQSCSVVCGGNHVSSDFSTKLSNNKHLVVYVLLFNNLYYCSKVWVFSGF